MGEIHRNSVNLALIIAAVRIAVRQLDDKYVERAMFGTRCIEQIVGLQCRPERRIKNGTTDPSAF